MRTVPIGSEGVGGFAGTPESSVPDAFPTGTVEFLSMPPYTIGE